MRLLVHKTTGRWQKWKSRFSKKNGNEPVSSVGPAPFRVSQWRTDVSRRILAVIGLIRPGFTPLAAGCVGRWKRRRVGRHGPRRMLFVAGGSGRVFTDIFEAGCVAHRRRRRWRRGGGAARAGGCVGAAAVVVDAHALFGVDEGVVVAAFLTRSGWIGWEARARSRRNSKRWRIASAPVNASAAGSIEIIHPVNEDNGREKSLCKWGGWNMQMSWYPRRNSSADEYDEKLDAVDVVDDCRMWPLSSAAMDDLNCEA